MYLGNLFEATKDGVKIMVTQDQADLENLKTLGFVIKSLDQDCDGPEDHELTSESFLESEGLSGV